MSIKDTFKNKKLIIRILLFVVAFITAVTAFTKGVLSLSKNKEGYQVIDASPDEEAILYANDFTFTYHFTGKSSQIKELRRAITVVYSSALSRAYKLLDAKNTYDGFNNLATINASKGSEVNVGEELYRILKDSCLKTSERKGYNMFAGPLYEYVDSILILEDPEEFDPLNNGDTTKRIDELVALASKEEYYELRFIDDTEHTVSFAVSQQFTEDSVRLEAEEYPVIDLNILHDAYILEIVCQTLKDAGYTDGYITSKSGITYVLSEQKGLEYCIYGLGNATPSILKTWQGLGSTVISSFKAFGFGNEAMYYSIKKDGQTIYRNPYIDAVTGKSSDMYLSIYTRRKLENQSRTGNQGTFPTADTVFRNLQMWSGLLPASSDDNYATCYVSQENTGILCECDILH
ncbi:MAG: hypothetical protein K6E85_12195 [Lachnospiraceae bacterium]|nr:hypothetical protein [Lachnospiraceae bacterium]